MIGRDGFLYYAPTWETWPATGAATGLVEVGLLTDTNYDLTRVMTDRRTRASIYAGANAGSIDPIVIAGTYLPATTLNDDTVFQALEAAFIAGTPLAFAYLDATSITENAYGPWSEFLINNLSRTDPEGDESSVSISITLFAGRAADPEFVSVGVA